MVANEGRRKAQFDSTLIGEKNEVCIVDDLLVLCGVGRWNGLGGFFVPGDGSGTMGVGPVATAFDQEVGVDFFVGPAVGDGDGGGAVFAMGKVAEELHCHAIGVEEEDGDVVLACTGDSMAVPLELEGVAGKGADGGG